MSGDENTHAGGGRAVRRSSRGSLWVVLGAAVVALAALGVTLFLAIPILNDPLVTTARDAAPLEEAAPIAEPVETPSAAVAPERLTEARRIASEALTRRRIEHAALVLEAIDADELDTVVDPVALQDFRAVAPGTSWAEAARAREAALREEVAGRLNDLGYDVANAEDAARFAAAITAFQEERGLPETGGRLTLATVDAARSVVPGRGRAAVVCSRDGDYAACMRKTLRVGDRVRAAETYELVPRGTTGTFYGDFDDPLPAFVIWDGIRPDGCFFPGENGAPEEDEGRSYCVEFAVIDQLPAEGAETIIELATPSEETPEPVAVAEDRVAPSGTASPAAGCVRAPEADGGFTGYAACLAAGLRPGDRVRAVEAYEAVPEGAVGTFRGVSFSEELPAFVIFDTERPDGCYIKELAPADAPEDDGSGYCLPYASLEVISGASGSASASATATVGAGSAEFCAREAEIGSEAYGECVRARLTPGMRVRQIETYENVPEGTIGTYYGDLGGEPPAFVVWDGITPTGCFAEEMAPSGLDSARGYCVYFNQLEALAAGAVPPAPAPAPAPPPVRATDPDADGVRGARIPCAADADWESCVRASLQPGDRVISLVDNATEGTVERGMLGTYLGEYVEFGSAFVLWDEVSTSGGCWPPEIAPKDGDRSKSWCVRFWSLDRAP